MSKGRLPSHVLDFKQFLLRRQVISLYREALRLIKEQESDDYRKELKEWTRYEFESKKGITDQDAIKMHLSKGRMTLKEVAAAIRMSK